MAKKLIRTLLSILAGVTANAGAAISKDLRFLAITV